MHGLHRALPHTGGCGPFRAKFLQWMDCILGGSMQVDVAPAGQNFFNRWIAYWGLPVKHGVAPERQNTLPSEYPKVYQMNYYPFIFPFCPERASHQNQGTALMKKTNNILALKGRQKMKITNRTST